MIPRQCLAHTHRPVHHLESLCLFHVCFSLRTHRVVAIPIPRIRDASGILQPSVWPINVLNFWTLAMSIPASARLHIARLLNSKVLNRTPKIPRFSSATSGSEQFPDKFKSSWNETTCFSDRTWWPGERNEDDYPGLEEFDFLLKQYEIWTPVAGEHTDLLKATVNPALLVSSAPSQSFDSLDILNQPLCIPISPSSEGPTPSSSKIISGKKRTYSPFLRTLLIAFKSQKIRKPRSWE
jgi:hypothetical protein